MPMKDVQGSLRGKCNQPGCDCKGYEIPGRYTHHRRCEYCDHTPTQHVKIIELGECQECDCEKYEPEDPCSYTGCAFCGCSATRHSGAEECKSWLFRICVTSYRTRVMYVQEEICLSLLSLLTESQSPTWEVSNDDVKSWDNNNENLWDNSLQNSQHSRNVLGA